MSDGLIPMRYAKALYKFAAEQDMTARMYDVMKNVIASFEQNPDLQKVMTNSFVSRADKHRLLMHAAGKEADDMYSRFVNLVLDHKREPYAYAMALAYRDLYRKENNISKVVITTAATPDKEEKQRLQELVERSFKGSTLEVSFNVDPDIIGGFVIDVDQVRMDASISNELETLRQKLLSK